MGLRDQVRPASFRGKRFTPVTADTEGLGRRAEPHEFPFRDTGFVEDFGKQTPTYTFDAFVTWAQRGPLVDACRDEGPGQLIHPIWGERTVICTGCVAREATSHVGVTYLTLSFVDAGQNRFPGVVVNTKAKVESTGETARAATRDTLVERFPTEAPQWVNDAAVGRVDEVAAALERARALVPGSVGLAEFNALARALDDPASLIASPSLLATTLSSTIQGLAGLSTDPLSTLRMVRGFIQDLSSTFTTISAQSGTSRDVHRQQQDAIQRLALRSAVIEGAVATRIVPLSSYQEAAAQRTATVELFDDELDAAGERDDDQALAALLGLRTQVLEDLRVRGAALATVRTITLSASVPAVVLAYQLYGDPDRGDEIVARNRVRHPTFLPAAVPLEVLSA